MTTYGLDTGSGDQVTVGLQEHNARAVAQRMANGRGMTLYLYALAQGEDGPGESEAIAPEVTVTASNPRKSTCASGAVDVDVEVSLGDVEVSGEVTLVPSDYDGRPDSWGCADNWVCGELLAELRARLDGEDGEALSDALGEILTAARGVVPMDGGRIDSDYLSAEGE